MHSSLKCRLEPKSYRYGRLLNWQNPPDPFWHYGIGLSDSEIFDTGQGLRPFHRKAAKLVVLSQDEIIAPPIVIRRLSAAVEFFDSWEYNFLGWNCEHLARLVATGKARCYQSQPIWWACNLTSRGDHKLAARLFEEYLLKSDPEAAIGNRVTSN